MKKVFKLGLATVAAVILLVGSFALGAYASSWLSFTGDVQVTQTKDNIDEIMSILERVNEDKITAEEALAELETLNPHDLKEQIKRLKEELKNKTKELENKQKEVENKQKEIQNKQKEIDDKNKDINQKNQENDELRRVIDQKDTKIDELNSTIEQKDNYINHLEKELIRANEKVADVHSKSNNAVNQAREYVK